jgi:uncharacterized membrane protein YecN with MAPEG domain
MSNEQSQHPDQPPRDWHRLVETPLPRPTYFPAGLAMGAAFVFWGLITTWVVWLVGVVLFIAALAGWITEIRHELKSH